jgi:hypothetical protein
VPCYRCGTRQADPEPGKPSPWRRGVVGEHQVLICPACHRAALADLTRCDRCGGVHLIRRLDQVECLDCHLTRDAAEVPAQPAAPADSAESADSADPAAAPPPDSGLAAEVARALQRLLGPG